MFDSYAEPTRWPANLSYFNEVIDWLDDRIRKCRKHIKTARLQNRNLAELALKERLTELRGDKEEWRWDRDRHVQAFLESQRAVTEDV